MQKFIVFTLSILVSTLLPMSAMFVGEGANGDEEEDERLSLQTHHHCPPKIPEFIRNVGPKGRLDFAKLFVNNLNTTKVTLYEKMKEWADEYDVRSEFDKFVVKHEERKDFFHELLSKNLAGDALELYGKIWDAQHDKEISFISEHKQIAQAFNESKPDIRRMVKILVRPMLPCLRFPKSWRQSGSSSASSSSSSASSAENAPKEGQRIPAPSQFHPRMGQINNGNASPPRLQAVPIPVHYGAGGQQQLNGNDRRFGNGNSIDDAPAPRRYGSDSDYRIVAQPSSHRNPFTQNGNEESPVAIQPAAQRPKNPPPNGLATAENSMSKNNKQDTDFVISDSQTEQ